MNPVLMIHKPRILNVSPESVTLIADIVFPDGNKKELWYEMNEIVREYLTDEIADSFVVALLPIAMQNKWDIKVVNSKISTRLLFNLNEKLIPVLSKYSAVYNKISVFAETYSDTNTMKKGNYVGTGLSCGVDSFDAIMAGMSYDVPNRVNCVTFFNVGQHRSTSGLSPEESRALFNRRKEKSLKCSTELKLQPVIVNSNLGEILTLPYVCVHQFCNFSAVLACGTFFSKYYYASGVDIENFSIKKVDEDTMYYETFLASVLSNENVTFYIEGLQLTRLDKIKRIAEFDIAHKYLNVCFKEDENCGVCEKCIRTQMELYSINCIEKFSDVFDVEKFNSNKNKFLLYSVKKNTLVYNEILKEICKNKIKIPFFIKLARYVYRMTALIKKVAKCVLNK